MKMWRNSPDLVTELSVQSVENAENHFPTIHQWAGGRAYMAERRRY